MDLLKSIDSRGGGIKDGQLLSEIIDHYLYSNSWSEMVTDQRSQLDARMDVKCGLAALHSRYGVIKYK